MKRLLRGLLLILPLTLCFSFWPVIRLGGNESMNFELSLPLLWLVIFDIMGLVELIRERKTFDWAKRWRWLWTLFPIWSSLIVVWSPNLVRGILTVGIIWLLYFAGYVMWALRGLWNGAFKVMWWKCFWGSSLLVCGWCIIQCILDVAGVPQEYSLMCDGCTYRMFGFPHPNGFAIEPQFMGNLLLAPAMAAAWLCLKKQNSKKSERSRSRGVVSTTAKSDSAWYCSTSSSSVAVVETTTGSLFLCSNFLLVCFFILTATLFLTFSRGAIYAFVVGVLFMSGFMVFGAKKQERSGLWKRMGLTWSVVVLAFVMALNLQGLMAEVGPTDDTYFDGVAKVVNHLSLGVIDLKGDDVAYEVEEKENTEGELVDDRFEVVEKPVENFEENSGKEEAIFDGYVAESTDTRVRLSGAAIEVWSQNIPNVLFGVGLGGAGYALYNNGLSPAPKEIVQNEYVSLLLETGLIGISLFALMVVLVVRLVWKASMRVMILSLLVAYGISLVFFSGLPNALHIYLLPAIVLAMYIPETRS